MNPDKQIDSQRAFEYDQLARKYQWFGPEILFGLYYEFINAGQTLLDVGIGTGLCSSLFYKHGLEIYGIDGSNDMLEKCRLKGIATELKNWDLLDVPLPYPDARFDHVISGGVFHFFNDLQPLFTEIARLVKANGTFAFTTKVCSEELPIDSYSTWVKEGKYLFSHSDRYLRQLLNKNGFEVIKELKFFSLDDDQNDLLLKCYLTQK